MTKDKLLDSIAALWIFILIMAVTAFIGFAVYDIVSNADEYWETYSFGLIAMGLTAALFGMIMLTLWSTDRIDERNKH